MKNKINEENFAENARVNINLKRSQRIEEILIQFIWANHKLQTLVFGILNQSGKLKDSLEFKPTSSFVTGLGMAFREKTNYGIAKMHWHEQGPLFLLGLVRMKDDNLPNWWFCMLNLKYIRIVILAIAISLKIQQDYFNTS